MRKFHVAVTADPEIPVPPKEYGGIERIIQMLVCGLVERGHDVTLFANRDSDVPCRLQPYPAKRSNSWSDLLRNMLHVSEKLLREDFDLVHSFGRLAFLLAVLPTSIPKIMSYQRFITRRSVECGERLARGNLHFTGCSRHIIEPYQDKENWHIIYNGVPLALYQLRGHIVEGAPLLFIGRIEEIKGVHLAIDVALRSGRSLIIAGNIPDKQETYFLTKIAPNIDGKKVQYVGPVNDNQKNELLGKAAAFLMPVLWKEPFGIVMIEALACGTPVIGLNYGAVPEIVENGLNGFVCQSVDEMVQAVKQISLIDRTECRRIVEEKFSDRIIVDAYLKLYSRLISTKFVQ